MPLFTCCRKNQSKSSQDTNTPVEIYRHFELEMRELTEAFEKEKGKSQKLSEELARLRKSLSDHESTIKTKQSLIEEVTLQTERLKAKDNENEKTLKELRIQLSEKEEKLRLLERTLEDVKPKVAKRREVVIDDGETTGHLLDARKISKTQQQSSFLRKAIEENSFLKHLNPHQVTGIIEYAQKKEYPQNQIVIKEGANGDRLYILQSGECEVTQNGVVVNTMKPGTSFGELAILYNCKRTATIKAKTPVEVWYLERALYKQLMVTTGRNYRNQLTELVKDTPLRSLGANRLAKIADAVTVEDYHKGEYIVRQGEIGKIFFIIKEGEVDVTVSDESNHLQQKWIRTLKKGDSFGEKALQREDDRRTANIIVKSQTVVCLALEKHHFRELIGDVVDVGSPDDIIPPDIQSYHTKKRSSLEGINLTHLEQIAILGQGGFGRVELVRVRGRKDKTYALKCMKKQHIVETKQEEHIFSEKNVMMRCNSPFIVELYATYKNKRYVYMLMEACLGGELWTRLRDENRFTEDRSRFYTACVVEALDYLHGKGIVYRDLKPENLLLDSRGYLKLVDFGFSKTISSGERTWTFCGTPEYVSPEIILNQGHDIAADYWALGILIFEFLTGNPPFNSADPMRTYRMALRGIDAIEFPICVKKTPQNLIRRLCREKPTERLGNLKQGVNGIRSHKWFNGFDWFGLRNGNYRPAYIPKIDNAADVRNFDRFEAEDESVPEENSGWDKDF